jgi:hypothetical protein
MGMATATSRAGTVAKPGQPDHDVEHQHLQVSPATRRLLQAKVAVTVGKAAIAPDRPASDASSGHVRPASASPPPFETSSQPHSDTARQRREPAPPTAAARLNII